MTRVSLVSRARAEVVDEVADVLEADRDAQHAVGDADRGARLGRQPAVRRRRRVGDERLRVAEVVGDVDDLQRVHQRERLVLASVELEGDDGARRRASGAWRARAAGATPGTGSTTRVTRGCDSRNLATSRALSAIRSTRSDMRLEALDQHPRVERRHRRARVAHEVLHRAVDELLRPEHGAAEGAALAVDVLGRGVDDDVGAELERLGEDRRAEDVVDDDLRAGGVGEVASRRAMSTSSCIGLLGVSKKTAVVGSESASRHWSRSAPSTKTVSTPQRGRISSRMTKHEPKRARDETTRSPWPSSAASATKTADMPEPVAKHASAPSIWRSRSSNIATVGLP